MGRVPIVAGNWKMNKNPEEGFSFVDEVQNLLLVIKHVLLWTEARDQHKNLNQNLVVSISFLYLLG